MKIEEVNTGISESNSNSTMVNQPAIMQQQSPEFLKWQFENVEPVEKLRCRLLGLVWDGEKGVFVKRNKAMINNDGANWILMNIEVLSDKIVQLSHYDKDEIDTDINEFEHMLVENLFTHNKVWAIPSLSDSKAIRYLVKTFVKSNFNRGLKGEAYKGLSSSTQHTEVVQERQAAKQSRWKNFLPGM